ncbi:Cytochrome c-type biosis protein CcdA [Marine Group I thaumarchaeote SCGC AAA799-E16]|uniref:Cytochrome c-type biosis protein CcdA n=4 Tax=Marine Group I TaxID=905826 RepID=A0A087S7F8_9ARCH|nr:Cytochrome c-type biosis protein CcdA [Marine Group I thaumarchaeote SCGC AAA799-N04]KER05990.1 Cytochrome c-type biosis protein CcdA [Marine Group I thaumarchaeote SCGC AAA799-E16]KFM18027.1 Cytochrome c-type biosis protein CcdA [Marine Group I thaumarchaeote SCGC RSA3]KFM21662.1 Cytochrome c-type biosis protein CcdA [Marine Group I thaumarchaeote SCGC AAA799-B03]
MAEITLAVAALAGLSSFVAPCILPMIPAFLAYISGTTLSELNQKDRTKTVSINRANIILNSVFFVLGFSVVFSTLGVIINSTLSSTSGELVEGLNQVGGIIIVGFGIFLLLSMKINKLNLEKKFFPKRTKASYPMSFVFGLAFAAGWTPCVGPILGTILTLAATTPSVAFNLLLVYSLGLGIPFILIGIFYSRASKIIRSMSKHLKYYNIVLGGFIVILGVLVYTNQLAYIANFPLLNELLFLG